RVLWKDKDCIQIRQLWNYLCTYCYLPRLANYGVLENAIRQGLSSREYFGIAAGASEGRYMELTLGVDKAFINQSDFLVKPEAAKVQIAADEEEARKEAERKAAASGEEFVFTPLDPGSGSEVNETTTTMAVEIKPKEQSPTGFHMSVKLDNTRVNKNVRDIMEEIVSHLATLDGAEVELRLEVAARVEAGVPVPAVRAVSENCKTLNIDDFGFTR
ncbi:MAG: hypothetical protein PUD02_01490, partial [Eggerthellales bacterium]|nr:hypothetical protein [Eggerthellales bacterium]